MKVRTVVGKSTFWVTPKKWTSKNKSTIIIKKTLVDESASAFDDEDSEDDAAPLAAPAGARTGAEVGAATGETTDDESGWASDSTDIVHDSELVRLGAAATEPARSKPGVE